MNITKRPHVRPLLALPIVAIAAGLAVSSSAGAASAPATCGAVITDDVTLRADLVDCPGSGLVIGAPGVTIDLAGHVIDGTGVGTGIDNEGGHDDVRIVGGEVREFLFGVYLFETEGGRVERVTLRENVDGLIVQRSASVDVDRVTVEANSFTGIDVTFSDGVSVRRSASVDNGFAGLVDRFNTNSRHERNTLAGNDAPGLILDGSEGAVLDRNEVTGNASAGIELTLVRDAVIQRNVASFNAGDGISIDAPGNTVARNVAEGNGGFGIAAPDGTVDGGRNHARNNLSGDCSGVVCE